MTDLASAIENVGIYAITVWAILQTNDKRWFIIWLATMAFVLCASTVNK